MFDNADNIADMCRIGLPFMLLTFPIMILFSSNLVQTSSEFPVHRMMQYDVNGVSFGCRSSALSLEAKSLYSWSTGRHCVVAKFQDITVDQFKEIRQKAGGLVLLLPKDVASISMEEKKHLIVLEQAVIEQSIKIPVYFSAYNIKLEEIILDITKTASKNLFEQSRSSRVQTNQRDSAFNEVFNSISANGYQIIVTEASHANNKNSKIAIIQGKLESPNIANFNDAVSYQDYKFPTIIVAAHLNTFGMNNDYPLNADSAVILTLADMFSKLHNTSNAVLKYRILFLLTESGPLLNYQGTKKWLEENMQLQNVEFVLCLDSIIQPLNVDDSDHLYMHVSKPPKENTPMYEFFKHFKSILKKYSNITTESVHKKINLSEPHLAWEHERFSIKRIPSFTLSSVKSPNDPARTSIFRDREDIILKQTRHNVKIIAEALARYIHATSALRMEGFEVFTGAMNISNKVIQSYMNLKSALYNNDIKNAFDKYLKNVKVVYEKPNVREPDFMLYEGTDAILNVYRVKPAVFDLFLTIIIFFYLCSVYFVVKFFPDMYAVTCKMSLISQGSSHINNHVENHKAKST